MLFNSFNFLLFIVIFIPLYYVTIGRARLWVSLFGSYIFYGWWDYRFLFLIWLLTLFNYYLGFKLYNSEDPQKKRFFLFLSITFCLMILGFFKYYNFFTQSFIGMLSLFGIEGDFTTLHIILPVGISFYTFQVMSYVIDVYRGTLSAEKSLLHFATFVAFFPQLVAGPIVRASCFIPQLKKDNVFKFQNIIAGSYLVIWGFFLKIAIADSLSMVVDICFKDPEKQNSLSMLAGCIFYAFQIYGDFAGYSFIAIGIARILGFTFPVNFNCPYFSRNFSEFWQRWHISLSSWLRDYLYIPLGGNRFGMLTTYRNLLVTMLLGGLWHGASWNFIIWGGVHGLFLVAQRMSRKFLMKIDVLFSPHIIIMNIYALMQIFITFTLICMAWVFFRSANVQDSLFILKKIFQFESYNFSAVTQKFHVIKGIFLISVLIFFESMSVYVETDIFMDNHPYYTMMFSAFIVVFISLFGTFGNNAFIYFQF